MASTVEIRTHCLGLEVKKTPYTEKIFFYTEIYNLIQENAFISVQTYFVHM